jgi:uncharacterized membrane protein
MRTIGIVTTWIVGLAILVGIAVGLRSMDDMKRYAKMRSM